MSAKNPEVVEVLDDDEDIPDAKECGRLCDEFAAITNTNTALAQSVLQEHKWDLQVKLVASKIRRVS